LKVLARNGVIGNLFERASQEQGLVLLGLVLHF
jgi:hypothetical protein